MAIVNEIIRIENDGTLSFGNYEVDEKQKVNDFDVNGDKYQVRTHKDVTRITKNSALLLETVPGSAIHNLKVSDKGTSFTAEGMGNTQFTLELENDTNYKVIIDDVNIGKIKSSVAGKLAFSAELSASGQSVKIEKG